MKKVKLTAYIEVNVPSKWELINPAESVCDKLGSSIPFHCRDQMDIGRISLDISAVCEVDEDQRD